MLVVPAQCRNEDGNSKFGKLMHLAISLPDIRGIEVTKPPFIRTPLASPGSVSVTKGIFKIYNIILNFKTL